MNVIGKKIRSTRIAKGLTQEELAELSKINLRTIQRVENNESEPRGKTLSLICNVLDINIEDLPIQESNYKKKNLSNLITNGFFLLILNFALMGIYGFLTLDSEANFNSRFGAFLLSFFLPYFIVSKTQNMSGIERMLKFGIGFIFYILLVLVKHGFPTGFLTGLFPSLIIALSLLYYGKVLNKK
jgi:transcriptional regulator with XRE-family HTH domain